MRERVRVMGVAACLGLLLAAGARTNGEETPAQKAAKLYATAVSQHGAGQYRQAVQLLDQFVELYPTNERTPGAYLFLAQMHRERKNFPACEAALKEVVNRFYSSGAWWRACLQRLDLAWQARDGDRYRKALGDLAAQAGLVPLDMSLQSLAQDIMHPKVQAQYLARYRRVFDSDSLGVAYESRGRPDPGWIDELVAVSNTRAQAEQALALLEPTLKAYENRLPVGWQYAQIRLLEKAGKAADAEALFEHFLQEQADNPAGISLVLLRQGDAEARKDAGAVSRFDALLMERYWGWASVRPRAMEVLRRLASRGRYEEFAALAQRFLQTYSWCPTWQEPIFRMYLDLARPVVPSGPGPTSAPATAAADFSRVEAALKFLDGAPADEDPAWQLKLLQWRIELLIRLGKTEDALALARAFAPGLDTPVWRWGLVQWKAQLLQRLGKNDEAAGLVASFAVPEEADDKCWRRDRLRWTIDFHVALGRGQDGVKLAEELVSEGFWSTAAYVHLSALAAQQPAYAPVLQAARKKWGMPAGTPAVEAKLKELQKLLQADEVRHAEEIAQELLEDRGDDAFTIAAANEMFRYYRRKVLRDPRDQWAERILKTWPYHPVSESVLDAMVDTMTRETQPGRAKKFQDLWGERFPGTFLVSRPVVADPVHAAAEALPDPKQRLDLLRKYYGGRAAAGALEAIDEIASFASVLYTQTYTANDKPRVKFDNRAMGDFWMELAKNTAGKRAELYCLCRAYGAYMSYDPDRAMRHHPAPALEAARGLQKQEFDPEVRWRAEFGDVNLLAEAGKVDEAMRALYPRLPAGKPQRAMVQRLDILDLGIALAKARRPEEALSLAGRLRGCCVGDLDRQAVEIMVADLYAATGNRVAAGRQFFGIVTASRWPIGEYWWFQRALGQFRAAKSPEFVSAIERYTRDIGSATDLIPDLLYEAGAYQVERGDGAAVATRDKLARMYPASTAHDRLDLLLQTGAKAGPKKK